MDIIVRVRVLITIIVFVAAFAVEGNLVSFYCPFWTVILKVVSKFTDVTKNNVSERAVLLFANTFLLESETNPFLYTWQRLFFASVLASGGRSSLRRPFLLFRSRLLVTEFSFISKLAWSLVSYVETRLWFGFSPFHPGRLFQLVLFFFMGFCFS